jgi:flagellar M-ring protein FliF
LVSAAVGANTERGDQVEVAVSAFETTELEPIAFYEQPWFATVLRYAAALIAVLLVLLLAVRPLLARMRAPGQPAKASEEDAQDSETPDLPVAAERQGSSLPSDLPHKVELARQLAAAQPDRALEALQRMLDDASAPGNQAPAR